ncbi:DegT/DnrJ/EryC1/StrS family aminotransferase [Cognatilysobacter bugurensis]|uniref:Aminotransferase n=1 Tax=Cognatilysobacter bugurensis TaxID=543356 RepID=A0A918SZK8_9GAMM|nr:DegT/DnrJ/EryC1/StrS family aminotransferase [Lysobacter bugurensis]GHA78696.1 aminotransferase [Lysobacter bugurensis]
MTTPVPFLDLAAARTELARDLDAAALRVLASGHYILGPETNAFEAEFAAYCRVKHAIGVGNGLDALMLILRALGIGAGHEVIVPANTFIATWLAVSLVGARPVPVEPRADTANLDPARVEAAISANTRAIMPVHLYGQCADMSALGEIAARHGLPLVEDAAQAQGATWAGARAGGLGIAAGFSFYPGKNLGAFGDAGAVTTNDDALAEAIRKLRNYGSSRKYVHELAGVNSRLDEMQSALLRVKLARLDDWNARRRAHAAFYTQAFAESGLTLPSVADGAEPVWHLYVVQVDHRDALQAFLRERGVDTLVHYPIPPYGQGAYEADGYDEQAFPISNRLHAQVLSLPMGPHLTDAQAQAVVDAVFAARDAGLIGRA